MHVQELEMRQDKETTHIIAQKNVGMYLTLIGRLIYFHDIHGKIVT